MAIAVALRKLGVGAGHEVLLPAYHCGAMVEPVVALGAAPIFYRIKQTTEVDLVDVAARLSPSTKAMIVTHYFGFPQPISLIRSFSSANNIGLLEDCAHMFFGRVAGHPPGTHGDFAIASAMKFFPVYDGGYLLSTKHSVRDVPIRSAGVLFDFKALTSSLEHAARHRRLWPLNYPLLLALKAKDWLWALSKQARPSITIRPLGPSSSDGGYSFDSRWIDVGMSRTSRGILRFADSARIVRKRRENYELALQYLRDVPGLTPLFSTLPADVVPHVFPILLDTPNESLPALKSAGIPLLHFAEYLWPGVDERACPISIDYSRRLVQLPCHQDLSRKDLEWILTTTIEIVGQSHSKNAERHSGGNS